MFIIKKNKIVLPKDEPVQRFIFSIVGRPVTKKRMRQDVGISKTGKKFYMKYTPDIWYEYLIGDAFREAFPGAKPIGWSMCEENPDMDEYDWKLLPGVKDNDLPQVELDIIFYILKGKIGDLDNYIKSVKDALNQYAWIDDRQVHHYKPYLVTRDDLIKAGIDPNSEEERVDVLIRPFSLLKNKTFVKLREVFERDDIYSSTEEMYDKMFNMFH